jgi:acyl-CoA synthetase (AMP-forming)/AMP-acid ligase II
VSAAGRSAPDLVETVLAHGRRVPDRVAAVGADDRVLTYGGLAEQVRRGTAALLASGMEPGDGVLFAVRPSPAAVVAALSVVAAGGTVVVADPGAGEALSSARLAAATPRWTMAEPVVHLATSGPLRRLTARRGLSLPDLRAPGLRHVVVPGGWLPGVPSGAEGWQRMLRAQEPADPPPASADARALVVFTSGTTSSPRAVTHTRGTLAAGLTALLPRLGLVETDVVHTDQMMLGLPVLAAGATWSFAPLGADGPTFARTAAARWATVAYAVPATVDAAVASGALPASLRLVVMGGAPVTAAVVRRVVEALPGARAVGVYGLTEALPVATVESDALLAHARVPRAGLLLGRPVPGTRVQVDDAGQLLVSGPQVSPGYLGEEPLDRVATGDLVRELPGGLLELRGRAKDMLLRGVTNIYPALVEPVVEALPGVAAAAVVGLPDPVTADEQVVLVLVAAPGAPATLADDVRRRLPGLVDTSWLPDHVVVHDALPTSGRSRKVDKDALREQVRRRLGGRR